MVVIGWPAVDGVSFLLMIAASLIGLVLIIGPKRTALTIGLLLLVGWPLWADQPYYWECGPWWWHLLEPWCLFR